MQNKRKFHRRSTYFPVHRVPFLPNPYSRFRSTRRTYADRKFIFIRGIVFSGIIQFQTELLEIFLFTGSHNCTGNDPRIIQDIATIERFVLLVFHFTAYGHDRTLVRSGDESYFSYEKLTFFNT